MKITFLLPHTRIAGGVKALLEYANRLHAMGHKVNLVIPAPQPRWYRFDKLFGFWQNGGTTLNPESIDWFENKIPVSVVPKLSARYLPGTDILAASSWQTAQAAIELPAQARFYFVQHHESLWTRDKEKAEATYRLPFTKIVISSWLKEIMRNNYGQDSHLFVTPVDRQQFFCDQKKWNRPRKVCMLHHDYDWKGFSEGMQAVRQVRSAGHNLSVVVFGEKMQDPTPLFNSAGFEFEYQYRPKQLQSIYYDCDIYLCPSWYEGLGMPAMEAMACRCALVTTDTGGCRDYAIDGKTALVSQPRDVDGLAKNLVALLTNDALLETLSDNGCRKIQEFDWEDNCRKLVRLFEQSLA